MENRSPQDLLQSLSPIGRALFYKFGQGPALSPTFKCIHHAYEFHARSHPDSIAVEDGQMKVTYGELDCQANCIATQLRSQGVMPGVRVGLVVERSVVMVVGILGILKAGGAYVLLDGNSTSKSNVAYALEDSDAILTLFQRKFIDKLSNQAVSCIEDALCHEPGDHCQKPEDFSSSGDSSCIIYTSDATNDFYGVDVIHKNVTNLVCNSPGNLAIGPGLRVAQLTSISCDMALWEFFGTLCNGGTLCLRGRNSKEWRAVMRTVDIVIATPSMLAAHDPADYPNLKVVAVAGEHCPKRLADAWAQSVEFYNCCGLVETTIVGTMHLHFAGESLGIGTPIPNNTIYLLDDEMRPVKIGDIGMMWVGGACVTRGYVNLSEKTAERYKRDPFMNDGSMMYKTGDLARWRPDGDLEHAGRVDLQVHIKGYKVELSQVAAAMETTPGVKSATAILIEGVLWGFYTPSTIPSEAVKASAARVLSHYSLPTKFMSLDCFPETADGKIDKKTLQDLAINSPEYTSSMPEIVRPPVPAATRKLPPVYPLFVHEKLEGQRTLEKHEAHRVELPMKQEIDSEPHLENVTDWTSSAGSTPRPLLPSLKSKDSLSTLKDIHFPPAALSKDLPNRPSEEKPLPLIDYPFVPFPKVTRISASTSGGTSETWWDGESRTSLTPTWVNMSSTTLDTATQVGTQIHLPLKKEIGPSSLESQTSIWASYEQEILPEKNQHRHIRRIRHRLFNTYRHLFGLTLLFNFCFFVVFASRRLEALEIGEAVVWNLGLSFFFRTDYVINLCFRICTSVPKTWNLRYRKLAAEIYHFDGFHTGIAISSVLWCIYFTAQATHDLVNDGPTGVTTLVLSWFIFFFFILLTVFSIPRVHHRLRASYENFDTVERFIEYAAAIFLWIQVPFLVNDFRIRRHPHTPLHIELRQTSPLWLLVLMTVSLLLPWVKLKKVPVYPKQLSPHAMRLYFDYTTPFVGSQIRLSDNPLIEWNKLTAIPEPGKPGFSVVLTTTGHWTSKKVAHPPEKLWVQGVPRSSVIRIATLFHRIVLVTTGSGITSCMPIILGDQVPFRLLWAASNPRKTFGDMFVEDVLQLNPGAVLYDTRLYGEPDLVKMTYRLVKEFEAEAVIVISNKATLDKIIYAMVTRGIAAYGSVGDEDP